MQPRIEGQANDRLATGAIEVIVSEIVVLNTSKTPPFPIEDDMDTADDIRLRYRYLDIRRPSMMANLRLRSDFSFAIRQALHDELFCEVETPALFKSTPEGARDFLVPSRTQPGHFYALPQSPQLLKQLLMVGGVERYYQVAKCFRDEDLRADRQPEFTQVDVEMSFVEQDDVMNCLESVLSKAFAKVGVEMSLPLRRISYWDAMDTYGSDKPDTRLGMELHDVTNLFGDSQFKLFSSAAADPDTYIKAINAKGAGTWARAKIDKLSGVAAEFGAKGLAYVAFNEDGSVKGPIAKFFSDAEMDALRAEMAVEPGDLVLFAVDSRLKADEIMGGMRNHMADALGIEREGHDFLWVVDFPLFHWDEERGGYASEHQPFTQPEESQIDLLDSDPLAVDPRRRAADAHPQDAWLRRGGRQGAVRLPDGGPRVRRASHGRLRARPRPRLHAARRRRLDPRGHGVPQDHLGLRPHERGALAGLRPPARGGLAEDHLARVGPRPTYARIRAASPGAPLVSSVTFQRKTASRARGVSAK